MINLLMLAILGCIAYVANDLMKCEGEFIEREDYLITSVLTKEM